MIYVDWIVKNEKSIGTCDIFLMLWSLLGSGHDTQPSNDKDSLIYRYSQQFLSSCINNFFFPHKSVLKTLHSLKNSHTHPIIYSFFKLKHMIRKHDFNFEIVLSDIDFSLKKFSAYHFSLKNVWHYSFFFFLINIFTLLNQLVFGSK